MRFVAELERYTYSQLSITNLLHISNYPSCATHTFSLQNLLPNLKPCGSQTNALSRNKKYLKTSLKICMCKKLKIIMKVFKRNWTVLDIYDPLDTTCNLNALNVEDHPGVF